MECIGHQAAAVPTVVRERVVMKLADVSVTADSGWHSVSDKRVTELVDTFVKEGLYGKGILRRPRVVEVHGSIKMASDGNNMLLDGKHTFVALGIVAQMYSAAVAEAVPAAEEPAPEAVTAAEHHEVLNFSDLLIKAITEGVEVDVVTFDDDDEDLRIAYCTQARDEATNKYKVSSIKVLVEVAMRYQKKAPGGSWEVVREKLTTIYGQRRTFVSRMLVAAQTLSETVLELLERHGVPNSYVYDNSYFNGHGREANKRLGEGWLVAVLSVYAEETTKGKPFSQSSFDTELRAPAKHAERWLKDRRREFGSLADGPAFRRVEEYLQSAQARPLILKCMRLGVRLHGEGLNSTGDQAGIDQCRILVQSLQEAMGRKAPATGGATAGISGDPAASMEVAAEASSGSAEMLTGMEAEDTAKAAAMSKTEGAKNRFLQYCTFSEVSGYLTRILVPSEKVIFFVDFITSKARAPLAALDDVGRFLAANGYGVPGAQGPVASGIPPLKVRIFVPTGSRLDLVTVIKDKLAAVAPTLVVFFITLTSGPLQGRKRSYFLLVAVDPASATTFKIPHSIEALATRARHGEGTRIRCLDPNCGLRSTAERQQLEIDGEGKGPKQELDTDHVETKFDDVMMDEEEAPPAAVVTVSGVGPRSCVRDLWPFAMPQDHYKAVLSAIVGAEASSHFVYLTSTAHPAALLAARDMNFQVHYVLDSCRAHSMAHGQKLLTDMLYNEMYAAELKSAQHVKRVHEEDVRFVVLTAPHLQSVRFDSVTADKNWRSGEDNCPSNEFLEQNLPRLFAGELDKFGLQSLASSPSM